MSLNAVATVSPEQHAYRRAIGIVARHVGTSPDRLAAPRGWGERRARRLALYLTIVGAGHHLRAVARATAIPLVTVFDALRAIEDQRDDPDVDRQVTELEGMMTCN